MARTCTVCGHPERASIDAAVLSGTPYRAIALRYGVGVMAVKRHAASHLELATSDAKRARDRDLFAEIERMLRRAERVMDRAETPPAGHDQNDRVVLLAIREQRATLELLARVRGDLDARPTVSVLLGDPAWLPIFSAIRGALVRYPGALSDVDAAMAQLEAAEREGTAAP